MTSSVRAEAIPTGIRSGGVSVAISILDGPPVRTEEGWDEVVDVTVLSRKGDLNIRSIDDWPDLPTLSTAGPGTYGVRAHAKGRDDDPHGAMAKSTEVYLFQIWPTAGTESIIHRTTDRRGAELRAQAAPTA